MRISTKSRYALSALIFLAEKVNIDKNVTINSISESLDISKLYLEQIFSQLKRAKLVISEKGSQGGYRLAKSANTITIGTVLRLFENNLFEKTESVSNNANYINKALNKLIWIPLDNSIIKIVDETLLSDLVIESEQNRNDNNLMYYI